MKRFTIADFDRQFTDDNACLEWLKNSLYPDGIFCKECGMITSHSKVSKAPAYACNRCGWHFYPMAGTIFERSRTSLKSWFYAMFLMSHTRSGVSAKQLQRELGVTYKTAWRMFKQIRKLLDEVNQPLFGEVEADETYIGGRRHGKRGRGAAGKSVVFGVAQRKGNLSATKVADVKRYTLTKSLKEQVLPKSMVYTDELASYNTLDQHGYQHKRVHHASKVWVLGDVHTNTIEGFWSILKRSINGVYHAVSEKYLQSYINEYAFRYNHRKDEQPMFLTILNKIAVS
jgi:transposase-like protein